MKLFDRTENPTERLIHGLNAFEMQKLAQYNSEQARGLMHTEAWREQMRELQQRFDAGQVTDV